MSLFVCTKCKEEKILEEDFQKNKQTKTGYMYHCKKCRNEYKKNNAKKHKDKYYQENREEVDNKRKKMDKQKSETKKRRAQESLDYYHENKDIMKEKRKKWGEKNKSHRNEWRKKYYENNTLKIKESIRKWYKKNPEYLRMASQRRKARLLELPHTLTIEEWNECLNFFDYKCAYCGNHDTPMTQEHVIPVINGGGYVVENIIPACQSCNSSKGGKSLEEWFLNYKYFKKERMTKILFYTNSMNINS